MDESFEDIIDKALENADKILEDYESYITDKFNAHALNNSPIFYSQLNRKSKEAKKSCLDVIISCFKKVCLAASIPLFKNIFKAFKDSISSYIGSAFSQYKSVCTSLYSKTKAASESALRESFLKSLAEAKKKARDFMLKREDIVISVGKRSYHLSNYIRIVLEQEVREKFNFSLLKDAKNKGAVGIRISDHNTKTKLCDIYEGKTFYFANNGLSALRHGLPPFHINCKHFIIPIYANN